MSRWRVVLAILALLGLAGLAAGGAADFAAAAHGWLLGFVFVSLAPPGALVLLMIARLTSAPWGEEMGPLLRALAAAAPWLFALGAPIAFLLSWIYPWARPGVAPAHLALYLSTWPFLARGVVAIGGWTLLAWLVWRGALGQLAAALGLVFQGVVLCIVPNDWVLSLRPGWTTTDIGMLFLTLEIALVASLILVFGPGKPSKGADDMAGFLIAGVLGLVYMIFVAWLIDWYGDLPQKTPWWLNRLLGGHWILVVLGLAAACATFASLGFGRHYRLAGGFALAGVAIFSVWLVAPTLGAQPWLVAPCGLVFHTAALALAVSLTLARTPARGAAHV